MQIRARVGACSISPQQPFYKSEIRHKKKESVVDNKIPDQTPVAQATPLQINHISKNVKPLNEKSSDIASQSRSTCIFRHKKERGPRCLPKHPRVKRPKRNSPYYKYNITDRKNCQRLKNSRVDESNSPRPHARI